MKNDPVLFERAQQGDLAARNELVKQNMPLCYFLARTIPWRMQALDVDDLALAGMFGLIEAIKRFDTKRGKRFISFARWYVLREIQRAVYECGSATKRPQHYFEIMMVVHREVRHFIEENGYAPSNDQVWERVKDYRYATYSQVVEILGDPLFTYSLDKPLEESDTFLEMLPDETSRFEHRVELSAMVESMVSRLAPLHQDIIRKHFGLGKDQSPRSVRDMRKDYGRSHEWIYAHEREAMAQLRAMFPEGAQVTDFLS